MKTFDASYTQRSRYTNGDFVDWYTIIAEIPLGSVSAIRHLRFGYVAASSAADAVGGILDPDGFPKFESTFGYDDSVFENVKKAILVSRERNAYERRAPSADDRVDGYAPTASFEPF